MVSELNSPCYCNPPLAMLNQCKAPIQRKKGRRRKERNAFPKNFKMAWENQASNSEDLHPGEMSRLQFLLCVDLQPNLFILTLLMSGCNYWLAYATGPSS